HCPAPSCYRGTLLVGVLWIGFGVDRRRVPLSRRPPDRHDRLTARVALSTAQPWFQIKDERVWRQPWPVKQRTWRDQHVLAACDAFDARKVGQMLTRSPAQPTLVIPLAEADAAAVALGCGSLVRRTIS